MTAPIKLSEIERLGKRTKHKCIPGEKLTNYYWEYSRATNPLTVTKLAEALRIAVEALSFYGSKESYKDTWKERGEESKDFKYFYLFRQRTNDFENLSTDGSYHFYAGKRSREALTKINKLVDMS